MCLRVGQEQLVAHWASILPVLLIGSTPTHHLRWWIGVLPTFVPITILCRSLRRWKCVCSHWVSARYLLLSSLRSSELIAPLKKAYGSKWLSVSWPVTVLCFVRGVIRFKSAAPRVLSLTGTQSADSPRHESHKRIGLHCGYKVGWTLLLSQNLVKWNVFVLYCKPAACPLYNKLCNQSFFSVKTCRESLWLLTHTVKCLRTFLYYFMYMFFTLVIVGKYNTKNI